MLRTIYLKINSDKTINIKNQFTIYQGEANKYRLEIDATDIAPYVTTGAFCTIGFKRENTKTDFIPTDRIGDNKYEYILKSDWLFDKVGKLWITLKMATITNEDTMTEEYAGNVSLFINALTNYTQGSSLEPSAELRLQEEIDELDEKVDTEVARLDERIDTEVAILDEKIDTEVERLDGRIDDIEIETDEKLSGKLDKNFSGNEYPTYTWDDLDDDEYVVINKNVDEETIVGKAKLQDLYNKVNNIAPVDGNISIDAEDIPYEDTNVSEALDYAVFYSMEQETEEPTIEVTNAKNDILGNQINLTYETKQHATETFATLDELEQFENEVSSTYETKHNVETTYETKEDALSKQTELQDNIDEKQNIIDANNKLSYLFVNGLSTVASSGSYTDLLNKPTFTTSGLQTVSVTVGSGYILSGSYDLFLISINTNGINEFKVLIPSRPWEKGEVYMYNKNTYDNQDEQYGRFIVWASASSNGIWINGYRDDTITYNMSGETVSSTTISKGVKRTSGTLTISYIGIKF